MTYPRTLSEALLLIDAQEERIKELLSAQSETRENIVEECAQMCDREADRQSAYESTVRDRGLKATHAAAAHILIAVAQRIRSLKTPEVQ